MYHSAGFSPFSSFQNKGLLGLGLDAKPCYFGAEQKSAAQWAHLLISRPPSDLT